MTRPFTFPRTPPDQLLLWAAAALVLLPFLLFSTPEYRQTGILLFSIAAIFLGPAVPAVRAIWGDRLMLAILGSLLFIHLFSFIGGIRNDEMALPAGWNGAQGLLGVIGIATLATLLLQPEWRRPAAWLALSLVLLLVAGSLTGFFIFIGWHLELSARNPFFEPGRLALVWPTRMLGMPLGQQFWTHANSAAYLFAAAWVLLVDSLHRRPRHATAGWILATALGIAIFLTASRGGLLMVAAALPFLLAFRPPLFALKTVAVIAASFALGFAGLKIKLEQLTPPPPAGQTPPPQNIPGTVHVSGIVERGSAGRLHSYQVLWEELQGARVFGHGLAATRLPFGSLNHEHSTYLATMRAGGIPSLAAHLFIAAIALWAGLRLARRGCRWPLLLSITIFTGLLFDRSTVIRLGGYDDFITHWLAVWIPVIHQARSSHT
jgi:hypothetical protein